MADRPILFSAPMVRAILREIAAPGTGKTQTRRLLNVDPAWHLDQRRRAAAEAGHYWFTDHLDEPGCYHVEPRYRVGDRLWVAEEVRFCRQMDKIAPGSLSRYEPRVYTADGMVYEPACMMIEPGKRRPPMFMSRWASRLTLHVTEVRVQRLQDISEDDAVAEGCRGFVSADGEDGTSPREEFHDLWDSLNAERAPWAGNPWVVAVTFRPVLGNIDSEAA